MAQLVDLKPHWINLPGAAPGVCFYVGASFLHPSHDHSKCPTCGASRERRLAFSFWPPIDPENLLRLMDAGSMEQMSKHYHRRVSGETFDTLTIMPSIGLDPLWHGNITNGEVISSN